MLLVMTGKLTQIPIALWLAGVAFVGVVATLVAVSLAGKHSARSRVVIGSPDFG